MQMAQSEKEDEELEEEKVTLSAKLTEDGVLVRTCEDIEGLTARGYGTQKEKGLVLEFYEALYLLSKGIIDIEDEKTKQKVVFQELLEQNQAANDDAWVRYLIYRDLRSRGYVVREGFGLGIDFRVYERGQYGKDTADYLIYGIQEGRTVPTEDLARTLNHVQNLKKKMILAVLNRRGEVVYYSLSHLTF